MGDIHEIIIAIIAAAGGITVNHLLRGWREARKGKKDEAQRIAGERDRAIRQRDDERHLKLQWRDAAYRIKITAMRAGADPDELKRALPNE